MVHLEAFLLSQPDLPSIRLQGVYVHASASSHSAWFRLWHFPSALLDSKRDSLFSMTLSEILRKA